jgi:hypothetical protein
MSPKLDETDRADLVGFLRDALYADRFFPRSKRVRRLKELLAKLEPAPAAPDV